MGRTSKFSFPLPGRKHAAIKSSPQTQYGATGNQLSKAQRVLGTDSELNIDSPNRDEDDLWGVRSDRSERMSIAISETTNSHQSIGENGNYQDEHWEIESGVLPRTQRLQEKASSTLLGQTYGAERYADEASASRHLRNEDSSSTLKSYYDRQKIPLAISQQTSASSTRDLALRKGCPPAVPHYPLGHANPTDPYNEHVASRNAVPEITYRTETQDKTFKKPSRLDLSMLFPRSRKNGLMDSPSLPLSPSSVMTNGSRTSIRDNFNLARRRLTKAPSRESMQSQNHSIRSSQSVDPKHLQNDLLHSLYDHYEQAAVRPPRMGQIPETPVPQPLESRDLQIDDSSRSRPRRERQSKQPTVQPTTRSSQARQRHHDAASSTERALKQIIPPRPWEVSSAASVSSHNTKASWHTGNSVFSSSDLKKDSVLSLSSESEGDASESEQVKISDHPRQKQGSKGKEGLPKSNEGRRQSSQRPSKAQGSASRRDTTKKSKQESNPFLTIPEATRVNVRLSGPWSLPKTESTEPETKPQDGRTSSRTSSRREQRTAKLTPSIASVASGKSSQQPTPPVSPSSTEHRDPTDGSSRYMAVTKQEEALLEALRQKRARMREAIIEEHETTKCPPRYLLASIPNSRFSETSSLNSTVVGATKSSAEKGEILLYLDTPIAKGEHVEMAEPSPDLSDFLSFGSDEDSTPRTSWAPHMEDGKQRKGAKTKQERAHEPRRTRISPTTPPSAARLSAVGVMGGGRDEPAVVGDGGLGGLKKRSILAPGVRFVDGGKLVNSGDFLMDEGEGEVIWGL